MPNAYLRTIQISEPKWTGMEVTISTKDNNLKPYISVEIGGEYFSGDNTWGTSLYFYGETGKDPFDPKNSALFGDTVILENSKSQISRAVIIMV